MAKQIFTAVASNDIDAVTQMLANDHTLLYQKNEKQHTPLHIAAARGHTKMARLLLKSGADVNGQNQGWEWRPIVCAAWNNHIGIVKLLIAHGADVTESGGNPVHFAGQRQHKQICRLLIDAGAIDNLVKNSDPNVLQTFRAAYKFDKKQLSKLLKLHPELANSKDVHGRTPLHEACTNGDMEIVKLLIESGANVNTKNDNNQSPLHRAIAHRHKNIIKLLKSAGAKSEG